MSKSVNTTLAILAGAAIGAVVGILYAPDKGSKTRKKIKDGIDDSKDKAQHQFSDFSESLKMKAAKTRKDLESTFNNLVADVDHKAENVVSTLEKKLEELKKHSSKIQK